MNLDIGNTIDSVRDGTKEVAEIAHKKTSDFHANYVSKVIPDCGKYGDAAKFVAEMAPGVAEYNAIREGDWQAFAISAGIDVAAVAIGALSFGAGYGAVKGGSVAAKTGVKVAAKEIAEAGAEKVVKEVAEAGIEKAVKEAAEVGAEKVIKEAAETGAEKLAKEAVEAGAEKAAKEAVEAGVEKTAKEAAEAGAEKLAKEAVETGAETATKEAVEAGVESTSKEALEKASLEVGEKIDKTHFTEYIDEIEKITGRDIPTQQKDLIEKALKENDFSKLSAEATEAARREFKSVKSDLIREWERKTGSTWPQYAEDVLNEAGNVIRRAGQNFDAHHIIELCTEGPNTWWNLHPASYPVEHQQLIHGAESLATMIFGK